MSNVTERRYCCCGATMRIRSDPETVRAILMWWFQWHTDPAAGHGAATRQQAANARQRQAPAATTTRGAGP